jgi:rfaE bifunctional protein nucleotidyltransferase chain/domain
MLNVNSIEQYYSENIIGFDQVGALIQQLKEAGKTVGLCHGGFDLVHPGHVKHFESAKKICDVLIVSITADRFVASRKGSGRPVYADKLRAYMVANVKFVDYVVITDFKKGIEIINLLKPSFYIKGPDFIHKTTPGIIAEREMITKVGGEIKYTTEPPMSTTKIIDYVKNEVDNHKLLVVIDRDGTVIENNDFLGRNDNWKEELKYKDEVINFISYLQTKFNTTNVVVTNQTGVARKLFTCEKVKEINNYVNNELSIRGVKIDNWQYCPDADAVYAELKKNEINFDSNFVKEKTKRKPSAGMVLDALDELDKNMEEFNEIIVIGDRYEDEGLAKNLKGKFIDVNGKSYEELVKEIN